jgi:hypothetical protein
VLVGGNAFCRIAAAAGERKRGRWRGVCPVSLGDGASATLRDGRGGRGEFVCGELVADVLVVVWRRRRV